MPRALILLPLMLVIQGAILYLLLRLVWRRREAVPIQGLEFYLTFSAVRYTIIL